MYTVAMFLEPAHNVEVVNERYDIKQVTNNVFQMWY